MFARLHNVVGIIDLREIGNESHEHREGTGGARAGMHLKKQRAAEMPIDERINVTVQGGTEQ